MNLSTIIEVKRPSSPEQVEWHAGCAWLAGGTWLFSEPQVSTNTLIDLESMGWKPLEQSDKGLDLAATCKIVELYGFKAPAQWKAAPLIQDCCQSYLASFKIWNAATIGGNICMSLPAGPMISLTVALEAVYTLWPRNGKPRDVAAIDFVTGDHKNTLAPGELLRSIHLPAEALSKRFAFRRSSLTHLGRSAVLIIGTRSPEDGSFVLTVTAATVKPLQFRFAKLPSADELRRTVESGIPAADYHHDVHGTPTYRRHLTFYYAEQIRAELDAAPSGAAK